MAREIVRSCSGGRRAPGYASAHARQQPDDLSDQAPYYDLRNGTQTCPTGTGFCAGSSSACPYLLHHHLSAPLSGPARPCMAAGTLCSGSHHLGRHNPICKHGLYGIEDLQECRRGPGRCRSILSSARTVADCEGAPGLAEGCQWPSPPHQQR